MAHLFLRLLKAEGYLRSADSAVVLQKLQSFSSKAEKKRGSSAVGNELSSTIRLLEIADRQYPFRPSCIRKALVLKEILESRGADYQLRVGVQRDAQGLQAHVWIERGGKRLEMELSAVDFKILETVRS